MVASGENLMNSYGKLCALFYDTTKKYASEKETSFYASFMKKDGRVLEAMCGSGRLLIPLLQKGFIVDGIDNAPAMLDRCRVRCDTLGLSPLLYQQSLEALLLPHKYDTVTIAVGSFQLIVDQDHALQALKNLRNCMTLGGDLLIDTFTPEKNDSVRSERIARIDATTTIRFTSRYQFHSTEKMVDAFCLYELLKQGVVVEAENELMQLTWYEDQEIEQLLFKARFQLVDIYDETLRETGPSRIVHARAID